MKIIKNTATYLLAPLLSLALLAVIFQLWQFDLRTPIFNYSQDTLFYLFVVKITATTGWFFQNDLVGFPHLDGSFYLHDFPIHADAFNFVIIRFFAYFSKDPFLLTNCFFLFTFALISFTSFVALRAFKIGVFTAVLISIIYTFLPYHFLRGVWHLFLSNYAAIPLVVMVSLWICEGKISFLNYNKKQQIALAPNRLFFISILIAIFTAANGVYYAFYACIIFIFAWFLYSLKRGEFLNREIFTTATLCLAILGTLILLYLPSFLFWFEHGFNNEVGNRDRSSSEFYGLRIIDLLMPTANHYLGYLQNLRTIVDEALAIESERRSASLGILISAGFIFLILWLIAKTQSGENSFLQKTVKKFSLKKDEENLISNLASLNLLSVLFACVGGLVMIFAMSFPLIRSHARFCVFIAFFACFLIAIIFDKLTQKNIFAKIAIVVITILALLDQVGDMRYFRKAADEKVAKFIIDRDFVVRMESSLAVNSQIFVLPVFGFPESYGDEYQALILYLHSQNLRFSYPAIKGREANLWQEKIVKMSFNDFIVELRKAGFNGIAIDRTHFAAHEKNNGWKKLRDLEKKLRQVSSDNPISSADARYVFFKI